MAPSPASSPAPGVGSRQFETAEQRLAALCAALCSPLSTCEADGGEVCVSECFGGLVRQGCVGRYADVIECLLEPALSGMDACSPFGNVLLARCRSSVDALHACDRDPEPRVPGPLGAPTNPSCAVTLTTTPTTFAQLHTCPEATLRAACERSDDDWSCACSANGVFYGFAATHEPAEARGSPCEQASSACGMSY